MIPAFPCHKAALLDPQTDDRFAGLAAWNASVAPDIQVRLVKDNQTRWLSLV
jgi:hypothetical protein